MVEKRLDAKWSGFRMQFEYWTAQPLIVHYSDHHPNNGLKKPAFQITIPITDLLTIRLLLTIQILKESVIQIPIDLDAISIPDKF